MQHLDLSGMNIALPLVTKLLQNGIYPNKGIASAHIGY